MNIKIEQTLHGYDNGHQLLMTSFQLSSEAKKTLLVQSDLSGSNIDENFKTYISGYPLLSHYALSKTWYADEMKRPGCVWTHTLLIPFSDLGKIADLDQLISLFKRPVKDQYLDYSVSIVVEKAELLNSKNSFDNLEMVATLLDAVYTHYDKTIIFPSQNSNDLENIIVQLWSNQWPRLRRNFSFCTGALSLKTIGGEEFDFQVVPFRNLNSIEKQTQNAYIVESKHPTSEWINVLLNSSKNQLRRFLWYYGSDTSGQRKNYKPLVIIFGLSQQSEVNFKEVYEIINYSFDIGDAKLLKNEIYNNELFKFDEKQLLDYLVLENNNENEYINNFDISEKLLNALKENKITTADFIHYFKSSPKNLIKNEVLNEINISDIEIINLINKDFELLSIFKNKIPQIASLEITWKQPYEFQNKIFEILKQIISDWKPIIRVVLKAQSPFLIQILKLNIYDNLYFLVKLLNEQGYQISNEVLAFIFKENKVVFLDFIKENTNISSQTCNKIFQNYDYWELHNLNLDAVRWVNIYGKIDEENTKIYASCLLLSFGLNRKVNSPTQIIKVCFVDVYDYAKKSKISHGVWQFIPIDLSEEEEEFYDPLSALFSYLGFFSKKKTEIPAWDYCEFLTRTLVNKFIKHRWPHQAFLDTLSSREITQHSIRYSTSFKKGIKFLKDLLWNIKNGNVRISEHQVETIKIIRKNLK